MKFKTLTIYREHSQKAANSHTELYKKIAFAKSHARIFHPFNRGAFSDSLDRTNMLKCHNSTVKRFKIANLL